VDQLTRLDVTDVIGKSRQKMHPELEEEARLEEVRSKNDDPERTETREELLEV